MPGWAFSLRGGDSSRSAGGRHVAQLSPASASKHRGPSCRGLVVRGFPSAMRSRLRAGPRYITAQPAFPSGAGVIQAPLVGPIPACVPLSHISGALSGLRLIDAAAQATLGTVTKSSVAPLMQWSTRVWACAPPATPLPNPTKVTREPRHGAEPYASPAAGIQMAQPPSMPQAASIPGRPRPVTSCRMQRAAAPPTKSQLRKARAEGSDGGTGRQALALRPGEAHRSLCGPPLLVLTSSTSSAQPA